LKVDENSGELVENGVGYAGEYTTSRQEIQPVVEQRHETYLQPAVAQQTYFDQQVGRGVERGQQVSGIAPAQRIFEAPITH
jgi:hypothetical protein